MSSSNDRTVVSNYDIEATHPGEILINRLWEGRFYGGTHISAFV